MATLPTYPVHDLYRLAVSHSPFLYTPSYVRNRPFRGDLQDGTLSLSGRPALTLRHDTDPVTGTPRMIGDVVIYDLLTRPVWTGVFNYATRKWDSWELVRYANPRGRADATYEHAVTARLTHTGRGACVTNTGITYGSTKREGFADVTWVGYDGVDKDGVLQYVILTQRRNAVPTVGKRHIKYGTTLPEGAPMAVAWFCDGWRGASTYRMTYYQTPPDDAIVNQCRGGVYSAPLYTGSLLPSIRHGKGDKRRHGHTPMDEALWLVGEDANALDTGVNDQVNNNTIPAFYLAVENFIRMRTDGKIYTDEQFAYTADAVQSRALLVPERCIANVLAKYGRLGATGYNPELVQLLNPNATTSIPSHILLSDADFFK